ncbi:MAG: STAS domain-containing protein [Thermicanus sp.]|nr:STAS domain-containing protein [Thermicanus sp.]
MEEKTTQNLFSTNQQSNLWIIRFPPEFTKTEENEFFKTSPWLRGVEGIRCILFDMTNVSYVNSAGIALLIRFVREARKNQYQVAAFGVSPHYQKIFRIVGLTSYIELFADEYGAIETLTTRNSYE